MKKFTFLLVTLLMAANWLYAKTPLAPPVVDNITFTTTKATGETVNLYINAAAADQSTCWIDLNNNGSKDAGEDAISFDGYKQYTLGAQTVTVYGNITGFTCGGNQLTALDVSGAANLKLLGCDGNQLTALDVSGLANLEQLLCFINQLTALDVSGLANLKWLACSSNQLTTLDVSGAANLTNLDCKDNQLTALDVSGLANLKRLHCSSNQLTALNVNGTANLNQLYCDSNQLTALDVSGATNLEGLNCYDNQLNACALDAFYTSLPDRTGLFSGYITVKGSGSNGAATSNTALATAKNWNVTDSNWDVFTGDGTGCAAQKITFTTTKAIGETVNLYINAAAADQSTCWIDLNNNGSKDAGEDAIGFDDSKQYTLGAQTVTVYGNITGFTCGGNQLTALDVSGAASLKYLGCDDNQLTALDLSGAANLNVLSCSNNQLTALDVSGLANLKYLWCHGNQLTALDLSGAANLNVLGCSNNRLTALDVSSLANLNELYCDNNQLNACALDAIYTALPDRSGLSSGEIRVKGSGSNEAATSNTALVTAKNWNVKDSNKDIFTGDGTGCVTSKITFTTTKAIGETVNLYIDAAAADQAACWIDLNNNGSKDAGEDAIGFGSNKDYTLGAQTVTVYGNITGFKCLNNKLTALDVSGATNLKELYCPDNRLTALDVSGLVNLYRLSCFNNRLTALDVSGAANLKVLFCFNNRFTALDVSGAANLGWLDCRQNQLTALDVSGLANLGRLDCWQNQLTALGVSGLANLRELYCQNNQLTALDVSGAANLENLYCYDNQLTALDVSGAANLENLYCYDNQLDACALDAIYAILADRTGLSAKYIVVKGSGSNKAATSNTAIATAKNWWVLDCNENVVTGDGTGCVAPHITFTTTKVIGEKVNFYIDAAAADRAACWIDLNNNGSKDAGEDAIGFGNEKLYTIGAQTVAVYGKITSFWGNGNKITALDASGMVSLQVLSCAYNQLESLNVSGATNLAQLYCNDNQLDACALDAIYTALTDRSGLSSGKITVKGSGSNKAATSNTAIATAKNWTVYDSNGNVFTGDGTGCVTSKITFTTTKAIGEKVNFYIDAAAADQSACWIDLNNNGSKDAGEDAIGFGGYKQYTLGTQTVTVYGDITYFYCDDNQLTALDVSGAANLKVLKCGYNQLTALNVNGAANLNQLYCDSNKLTALDVSGATNLEGLDCFDNQLDACALDELYQALPNKPIGDEGTIYVKGSSGSNKAATSNTAIATAKNWKVYDSNGDIFTGDGTGTHITQKDTVCSNTLPYTFGAQNLTEGGTYTETFTTSAGCDSIVTLKLTIQQSTVPTFTQVAAICEGDALAALPTTSTNSITGTWSPTLYNRQTTTYTFTPNEGQCATTATMTITVNQKIVPTFTQVAAICEGDALAALPTTSANNITGTWSPALDNTQTTEYTFTPAAGQCATSTTMTITVNPQKYTTIDEHVCEGNSFTFGTQTLTQTGTYSRTIVGGTANGCDSIVTLNLTVIEPVTVQQELALCSSSLPYTFGTQSLTEPGTYSETFTSSHGCDSTVVLTLTTGGSVEIEKNEAVCSNALPYIFGKQKITESGFYTEHFETLSGCDSVVRLHLTVHEYYPDPYKVTICESELPYRHGSFILTEPKSKVYTFSRRGCEGIYHLELTVIPKQTVEVEETVCANQLPYQFGSQSLTEAGTYTETFATTQGSCDSTVILHLKITNPASTSIAHQLCANELPYSFNEQELTQAGTYTTKYQTAHGCDSLVTLNLIVWEQPQKPVFEIEEDTLTTTNTDQYFWFLNGNWIEAANEQKLIIDKSGNYSLQVADENGCKSAVSDTIYVAFSPAIDTKQVQLQVYPNPTQDYIYIKGLNVADKAEIKLYNIVGELMLRQKAYNSVEKIDVQHLVSGVYLLSIEGTRSASIKIVKR